MTARGTRPDQRDDEAPGEPASRGGRQLVISVGLLLIGIGITTVTYSHESARGNTYLLAYGPIVIGLITIVRGLVRINANRGASDESHRPDRQMTSSPDHRDIESSDASGSALRREVLESLAHDATRVRCRRPVERKILYETASRAELAELAVALRTVPPSDESWYCMCVGTLVFELEGSQPKHITLHHGESLRWEGSDGNVALLAPDAVMNWLSARGMGFVREEYEEARRRSEASAAQARRWRAALPASLVPFFDQQDADEDDGESWPRLAAALEAELPDPVERARVLLDLFGNGAGPWSGFPVYEQVPKQLLIGLPLDVLLAAIGDAPNERRREGAARLFSSWDFHRSRKPDVAKIPEELRRLLLAHAEASSDEDKRGRARAALGRPGRPDRG